MLKAYASYFVAYLLANLKNTDNIERIILYGSAARDEARKDSDIDIFIEVKKITKNFEREISSAEKKFYQSREATLFKTEGIYNEFSIKIGRLPDWKELYTSIASTGIVLYGHYEAAELPSGTEHSIIVYWEEIKLNRGAFLNKVYGFNVKGRHYDGLLGTHNGKKLGKSCIMLPVQYKTEIFDLLKKHKVKAKTLEVFKQ